MQEIYNADLEKYAGGPAKKDEKPDQHGQLPAAELTPREREEKEKIREEVTRGLLQLYNLLSFEEKVKGETVVRLIDQTELRILPLTMKIFLSGAIEARDLSHKPFEQFLEKGLATLDLWIHTQALGRALEKDIKSAEEKPEEVAA